MGLAIYKTSWPDVCCAGSALQLEIDVHLGKEPRDPCRDSS